MKAKHILWGLMTLAATLTSSPVAAQNTAKYKVIVYSDALKAAAEAGDAEAQYVYGRVLANGTGIVKNEQEAVKYWQKSADQGNPMGINRLAWCYENGYGGISKDEAKAKSLYASAIPGLTELVNGGNGLAANLLGMAYNFGAGVTKNEQTAFQWYQKAANLGDMEGMRRLAVCYDLGTGVTKNEAAATPWYQKAAEGGDATAQYYLGLNYANGWGGLAKNQEKAVYWYQQAANQGYQDAQFNLGLMYDDGDGIAKDLEKAIYWYKQAANQGYAKAQCNLGLMYKHGEGVTKDLEKAKYWYTKAAGQGNANAMNNIGVMYKEQGNDEKAAYWYRRALQADPNNATAKSNLANCESRMEKAKLYNNLVAKYGKTYVDAFFTGNIVPGMHLDLVSMLTSALLLKGERIAGNAQTFTMKYSPHVLRDQLLAGNLLHQVQRQHEESDFLQRQQAIYVKLGERTTHINKENPRRALLVV